MFELLADALKALAGYPPLAAFASLVVIAGGVWLMIRGERDRKSNGNQTVPAWTMYGPVHDVMISIHHISEQSRQSNKMLEEILREVREARQALEMIRNESRLR